MATNQRKYKLWFLSYLNEVFHFSSHVYNFFLCPYARHVIPRMELLLKLTVLLFLWHQQSHPGDKHPFLVCLDFRLTQGSLLLLCQWRQERTD